MGANQSKEIIIRRFTERDAQDIIDLHSFLNWPISLKTVKSWSKGNEYTRVLVAETNGKVVGKVTLDTAYPPYCELVNLIVHPSFRKVSVASRLIQRCIEIAQSRGCPIISLMTEVTNYSAHRLYSKFKFYLGILPELPDRGDLWLFRFSNDSFVGRFLYRHPLSEFSVSPTKTMFRHRLLHRMRWIDPLTRDGITLFLEGQPGQPERGGTAPRIAGVSVKEGQTALDLLVDEKAKLVKTGGEGSFEVLMVNRGKQKLQVEDIAFMVPKGVHVTEKKVRFDKLKIGESGIMHFKFNLHSDFEIPVLSFATILITCILKIQGFHINFMVTAGFERD